MTLNGILTGCAFLHIMRCIGTTIRVVVLFEILVGRLFEMRRFIPRGSLQKRWRMTRKDSEKEADRPHYYSQFWLDVAAGRRVIGAPKPEEGSENADIELPEIVPTGRRGARAASAVMDGHRETYEAQEPSYTADEDEEAIEDEDELDEGIGDEEVSPDIIVEEETVPDFVQPEEQEEQEGVEEEEPPEEDEFFDEEEEEEDEDGWAARGRKKPKPGRQPAKPAKQIKKPKRGGRF